MSQAIQATDEAAFRAALGGIPLFHGLGEDDLDALTASVRTRRFKRGEVIFHQGDPGDALHVVLSGRIKISSPSDFWRRGDPGHAPPDRVLRGARAA